jgi:hypothetical protein
LQGNLIGERAASLSPNGVSAIAMAHFADKLHVDKHKIDRMESTVLLLLIGGGLAVCVLGSAVFDIGRALSAW